MIEPTLPQVRKLLDSQFPEYAGLPLEALPSPGTDNAIFRLGADLTVRLPHVDWAVHGPAREVAILSKLQGLGLEVPGPVALGEPCGDFPSQWSVLKWVEGEPVNGANLPPHDAIRLAGFLKALRQTRLDKRFEAGAANHFRGAALHQREAAFAPALDALGVDYDLEPLRRIWKAARAAPVEGSPVWLHGDLHGGNLLTRNGRLSGVIDWGLAGVGDGACDLSAAWTLFDDEAREVFREAMDPGEAAWLRGAGWALSVAVIFLAHYRDKGVPVDGSHRTISRLLEAFP